MRYVDLTKAGCLMEVLAWRTIAWHARATWDADLVKALQQSTQSTTNRAGQRLSSAISTCSRLSGITMPADSLPFLRRARLTTPKPR